MNRGKMVSLLFAAIVAVAFAAPAAASATYWTENHEQIGEDRSLELDGYIGHAFPGGDFACELGGEAALFVGADKGELMSPDFGQCLGWGGFVTCSIEVTEASPSAPLQATQSGEVEIYDLAYTVEFSGASCQKAVKKWNFHDVTLTGTPDDSEAMSALDLSGSGNIFAGSGTTFTGYYGELNVSPAGVFGIQQ